MADLDGYGEKLDQLEIHLGAMAGVLGRFRTALIKVGFERERDRRVRARVVALGADR
jgi:hypothetical protein